MTVIDLPSDIEAWARSEVAAGRAASLDDLVATLLAERRDFEAFAECDGHAEKVAAAYASVISGQAVSEEDANAEIDRLIASDHED